MAQPVDSAAGSQRDASSRTATPTATAAKSAPRGGRNFVKADKSNHKQYSKSEMDRFRNNKKKAPESIQQAWAAAEHLPKDDPHRHDLFEAMFSAQKGNYDIANLLIDKKWERSTGIHHTARN